MEIKIEAPHRIPVRILQDGAKKACILLSDAKLNYHTMLCCIREMTVNLPKHRASKVLGKGKQSLAWMQLGQAVPLELTFLVGAP